MSQMNPYAGSLGQEMVAPPKTSGMAVTALVMSLIFCCPVTTILGPVLGLIAILTIGNNPMRKGKGIAMAAIVIGIIMTIAQVAGGMWAWKKVGVPVFQGPGPALQAGFAGDTQGFKDSFHVAGTAPGDDQAKAFLDELRNRYGAFRSARFDENRQPQQQPGNPAQTFYYIIEFENATMTAESEILFADQNTGVFIMKPTYVIIEDPQRGDLTYPPAESQSGATSGSDGSQGEPAPQGPN